KRNQPTAIASVSTRLVARQTRRKVRPLLAEGARTAASVGIADDERRLPGALPGPVAHGHRARGRRRVADLPAVGGRAREERLDLGREPEAGGGRPGADTRARERRADRRLVVPAERRFAPRPARPVELEGARALGGGLDGQR